MRARLPAGHAGQVPRADAVGSLQDPYFRHASSLLVIQTVLITGLLIQRTRRQRAEENLRRTQEALQGSYDRIRDLGAGLLKAQETERARISRELHDDICQRMLLLTLELESFARNDADAAPATAALSAAREIATSLHQLSHQLHPTRLRLLGLVPALQQLCDGILGRRRTDRVHPRPRPFRRCLPTSCCACSASSRKACRTRSSTLAPASIGAPDGCVGPADAHRLDNGVGFDVNAGWGKGVGLASMTERLDAIGGSIARPFQARRRHQAVRSRTICRCPTRNGRLIAANAASS